MEHQDLEAKIVVLGAQGVGKTSLLNRYIHNAFEPSIPSTVGASFLTKRLSHTSDHPDATIRLQIWDTAGQERFRSISKLFYRGADAAILCYDITDEHTFDEMASWLEELRDNLDSDIVIHVVGTKADVVADRPDARQVAFERCIMYVAEHLPQSPSQAQSWISPSGAVTPAVTPAPMARSGSRNQALPPTESKRSSGFWGQDLPWDCCHEISSKDGEGVEEVFRVIARKLMEQRRIVLARDHAAAALNGYGATNGSTAAIPSHGYFADRRVERGGSFRVGVGDKRRSWLGFPVTPGSLEGEDGAYLAAKQRKGGKCC